MALKRKRSTTLQSSSPSSTTTTTSSPSSSSALPAFYNNSKPTAPLQFSKPTYASDPYAPSSRTRKRHRDDRPADAVVHACTIGRLYAAQRERPGVVPVQQQQHIGLAGQQMGALREGQKSTLHAFWSISQSPRQMMGGDVVMAGEAGPRSGGRCEDCDGDLQSQDAMDMDGSWGEKTCYSCRRNICDSCAVMGNERVCSACVRFE